MSAARLVIAAGGTGGHMFPAQALAEEMLARGWQVALMTDERGARYAGGFPEAVRIEQVPAATTARGGLAARLRAPGTILHGIAAATRRFLSDRPTVVAGFGGYPSIPALGAAWALRIPRLIHEQNGVPGRVNRLFARRVAVVACGTWPTALPRGVRHVHTGNPVRAEIARRAGAQYIAPGDYPMAILVMGGSQGARILSDVVPAALALLPDEIKAHLRISHQARPEDVATVEARYDAAGLSATVAPFFEDVAARMADAQLVISRAGASSVAEIAVIGRPAILIPYAAAADDHQTANAMSLADAGGAEVIAEEDLTALGLARAVHSVLTDPARAITMVSAACAHGRPDAAQALADLVADLAEGGERIKELPRA